ncbi:MAG: DUF305 domain-containing protein [Streptosporangiales bacterium]|nr:DUF305 domain-containing protein [Streptosporangiales bacterium]
MTTYHVSTRKSIAIAATAAALIVLAACGGNDGTAEPGGHSGMTGTTSSTSDSAGARNDADVQFAQQMIPHHRQAVQMADLAETRASSAEVKSLAATIKKAQGPEIKTMSGWLKTWGEPVPQESEGMDHSGDDMSGMMTDEDMRELEQASGKAFDTAFLQMMIKHHKGAVSMAKTEKSDGSYQPAKDMADDIIASQTAEITEMNKILRKQ